MCGNGNHQGLIPDTSVTRRTMLMTMGAVAAAGSMPAFAEDAGARPVTEKDVVVKTADGSADAALFAPAGKGKWPAVLMWPDILGLRPVFREMGKRLAAQGYVVLVPNPYYRTKKAPVVEGPFDFNSKDDVAKIMAFKQGLTDAMVDGDSSAFVSYLDAQPKTDTRRRMAVQGYCMSGPMSFRTAAVRPDRRGGDVSPRRAGHRQAVEPAPADPENQGGLPGADREQRRGEDAEGEARPGCSLCGGAPAGNGESLSGKPRVDRRRQRDL